MGYKKDLAEIALNKSNDVNSAIKLIKKQQEQENQNVTANNFSYFNKNLNGLNIQPKSVTPPSPIERQASKPPNNIDDNTSINCVDNLFSTPIWSSANNSTWLTAAAYQEPNFVIENNTSNNYGQENGNQLEEQSSSYSIHNLWSSKTLFDNDYGFLRSNYNGENNEFQNNIHGSINGFSNFFQQPSLQSPMPQPVFREVLQTPPSPQQQQQQQYQQQQQQHHQLPSQQPIEKKTMAQIIAANKTVENLPIPVTSDKILKNTILNSSNENGNFNNKNSDDATIDNSGLPNKDVLLKDPSNPLKATNLWVGNVAQEVETEDLLDLFRECGTVASHYRTPEKFYMFLNFTNAEQAAKAMNTLQGVQCGPMRLLIKWPNNVDSYRYQEHIEKGPVNGNECYFWRTTGCKFGAECKFKHIKANKSIDLQALNESKRKK